MGVNRKKINLHRRNQRSKTLTRVLEPYKQTLIPSQHQDLEQNKPNQLKLEVVVCLVRLLVVQNQKLQLRKVLGLVQVLLLMAKKRKRKSKLKQNQQQVDYSEQLNQRHLKPVKHQLMQALEAYLVLELNQRQQQHPVSLQRRLQN